MNCKLTILVCLGTALSTAAACAQTPSPDTTASPDTTSTTTPVAWVYVSYAPDYKSSNARKVAAWKAWPNGSLTSISGSPFNDNVESMAVNGKYLMAASNASPVIEAYLIEAGGALTYKTSTNYGKYNSSSDCGSAGQIVFDHTGADLYVQEFDGTSSCSDNLVASFAMNKTTGGLNYLGSNVAGQFPGINAAPRFIGNNVYAYTANESGCMHYSYYGFKRASNGLLNQYGPDFVKNSPTPPPGVTVYIPYLAAADPTNHVAFTMFPANSSGCSTEPVKLATFSVDSSGNLSTTSTYKNMPNLAVTGPLDMRMAPSGKLLAVGGQEGLQIFHFNGANPITHYTKLITTAPINQMFWDKHNHLYAISQSTGRVYVFTVTPTGWSQAPGSPHALPSPYALIVQPR
jgi:hypothetical protein